MKFNIKQEDGKVIVEVELPAQKRTEPAIARHRFQTEDVLKELETRKISHGKAIQAADLYNWRDHGRKGTWIFEEKTTKPLDKPAEKVILEVEKEKTIANKPKAKKKSTRKKKVE
tara:strand:+ start:358 stop:702 length:345 start_codon:yes stop_codon:yes gene_type:complete